MLQGSSGNKVKIMPPLTPKEQAIFDEATEHPYKCRCEKCKLWWANVPSEDEDLDETDEPAF